MQIYINLLRIIRPLELQGSYAKPPKKASAQNNGISKASSNNIDHNNENIATSPRADTFEDDDLDEEQIIAEAHGLLRQNGAKGQSGGKP